MAISTRNKGGGKEFSRQVSEKMRANPEGRDLSAFEKKVVLNAEQAWEKIKPYCGYQERCHSEVKDKLFGYGLHLNEVEPLIAKLIEDNYLNEERFAIAFAGGHSRIKKWGKVKIGHALKFKGVSTFCIKKALEAIDTTEYMAGLQKLADQKWEACKNQSKFERWNKCMQYLLQKGYEAFLVKEVLQALEE